MRVRGGCASRRRSSRRLTSSRAIGKAGVLWAIVGILRKAQRYQVQSAQCTQSCRRVTVFTENRAQESRFLSRRRPLLVFTADFVGWLLDFTITPGYIALRWGVAPGLCSGPRPSARFLGIRSGNAYFWRGRDHRCRSGKLQRRRLRPRFCYTGQVRRESLERDTTTASVSWIIADGCTR
jgi:hypothetical protein